MKVYTGNEDYLIWRCGFQRLHTSNVKLSMRIEEQLCSVESDCQRIDVLVSDEFGKFLALDGRYYFLKKTSLYMMRW